MSNSSLVCYTNISPNKTSPRNHEIDTVTIHCVVGQVTVESLGNWFAKPTTQASSNYGVDKDGRIGMYVEEKDRSWCSSNRANDNRAITIEVASDTKPPYAVTDKAYSSLIKLLADICQRNPGIKKLRWANDKSLIGQVDKQNMTVHQWFANKSCPGEYLFSRHTDIVKQVNALLQAPVIGPPIQLVVDDEAIWEFFKSKGLNDFAVAGIIGNLHAESGLRPNNLENGYEIRLNHTDASYTAAVDSGKYERFITDGAGYGLAQWTAPPRKKALLDYAKSCGKSVGDLDMQLNFMWSELQSYPKVVAVLKKAASIREASDAVLLQYERPADTSELVRQKRERYGKSFYDKFVDETDESVELYRVRKKWEDAGSQIGAYRILANAKEAADKNPGYYVFDSTGNRIYPVAKAPTKVAYAESRNDKLAGSYKVTASGGLNLRYEPGVITKGNRVKTVPKGAVVRNFGFYTKVNGTVWLLVSHGNDTGFVHSGYVRKT